MQLVAVVIGSQEIFALNKQQNSFTFNLDSTPRKSKIDTNLAKFYQSFISHLIIAAAQIDILFMKAF